MNGCMNGLTERLMQWILDIGESPVCWGVLILLVVLWLCSRDEKKETR